MASQSRKKRHDGGRFDQSASQCVCNLHVSRNDRIDQAGDAEKGIAAQLQWIAEPIIDSAEDDVDLLQPVHGLQVKMAIAHRHIRALYKRQAEILCKVRVLEVGFVVWSRRHQNNTGVVASGHADQRIALSAKERSEAQHVRLTKQFR